MEISSRTLKHINKYFNEKVEYNKLNTIEIAKLISDITDICKKNNSVISPSIIIDMRNTYIFLLSKTRGTFAHKIGDLILLDYIHKTPIIDIAKKYKLPSMSVVNQILIETKHESHKIEKMIKKKMLPKEIQIQMSEIMKNDPIFWFNYNIPNIHDKINKLNCAYKLKYDLKKYGKCPDILFDNECIYKRKIFRWIVFKPYILFDSSLHIHDIQKTINNFKRFGQGIILYNNILCSKSFIKKIEIYVDIYTFLD